MATGTQDPSREELLEQLLDSGPLLAQMELAGRDGRVEGRSLKKLEEISGFGALIVKRLRECFPQGGARVLECSCGKSYLALLLSRMLQDRFARPFSFIGVDFNPRLIEHSERAAADMGLKGVTFRACRTIEFDAEDRKVDVVLALHACDRATDEAIAKGISLGARLIMVVPCCQNQIRGQIRSGHPLESMSQFGPVRYHLANLLTDSLRALFLYAAGYHVEMDEIVSPRVTPKNLCIIARKVRRAVKADRARPYLELRDFFAVRPAVEHYCPGVAVAPGPEGEAGAAHDGVC